MSKWSFYCKRCRKNLRNGRSQYCLDCRYEIDSQKRKTAYQEKKGENES